MATWGDGEALDVELDEDCDCGVETRDLFNNCLGVRNSLSQLREDCPKVMSNILDVDLIRPPLTPSKKMVATQLLILFCNRILHSLVFMIRCYPCGCKLRK
jgi:hypothetical protein